MYSIHNEGKSVIAERFIRTLKNKTYKYMNSISKSVFFDKVDDIVNKYKDTYYSTIKLKPVNVKSSTYSDFNKENDKENPKFRISKYETFLQNFTLQYGLKSVVSELNAKEIARTFYRKEQQKTNEKDIRIEKIIKRNGDKICIKLKGDNNLLNSSIDKKIQYK